MSVQSKLIIVMWTDHQKAHGNYTSIYDVFVYIYMYVVHIQQLLSSHATTLRIMQPTLTDCCHQLAKRMWVHLRLLHLVLHPIVLPPPRFLVGRQWGQPFKLLPHSLMWVWLLELDPILAEVPDLKRFEACSLIWPQSQPRARSPNEILHGLEWRDLCQTWATRLLQKRFIREQPWQEV